jgi:hypothetical protein
MLGGTRQAVVAAAGMLRRMGIVAAATVEDPLSDSLPPGGTASRLWRGHPLMAPVLAAYGRRRTTGVAHNLSLSHLRTLEIIVTILSGDA